MASSVSRFLGLMLAVLPVIAEAAAPETSLPPRLRPSTAAASASGEPANHAVIPVLRGRTGAMRPRLRPGGAAARGGIVIEAVSGKGPVCGRSTLVGERLKPIAAGPGCGLAEPVRLTRVQGVQLAEPAIVGCDAALALDNWVRDGAAPAWGRLGRGLGAISVSQSLSCSAEAPAPSEHGTGRALDVIGFTLRNGVEVSVAKGWRDPVAGQVLRKARDAACEEFPVVRGPDSGRAYSGQLHLSAERSGRRAECR